MDTKIFLQFKIGLILIDLNQIFPIKSSTFENFHSVGSYKKKLMKITEIATLLKIA